MIFDTIWACKLPNIITTTTHKLTSKFQKSNSILNINNEVA